jgi:hypothetical protein
MMWRWDRGGTIDVRISDAHYAGFEGLGTIQRDDWVEGLRGVE